MYEVYKISDGQLASAARRTIKVAFKLMIIVYLAVMNCLNWSFQTGWKYVFVGTAICVPAFGLALLIGYALLKQRYRRYRIVLDDEGVEFYMPPNDKKIKWANLLCIANGNGTVTLIDKSRSAVFRWLTGKGSIDIIPELERFDELCENIGNYSSGIKLDTNS